MLKTTKNNLMYHATLPSHVNDYGASVVGSILGIKDQSDRAGEDAEQKLAALNAKKNAARAKAGQTQVAYNNTPTIQQQLNDPSTSVGGGFKEGLQDGARNIRQNVGGAINTVAKVGLGMIPWQIWLFAIVGGAIYLNPGLLGKLRK